jgi:hypothetical protein
VAGGGAGSDLTGRGSADEGDGRMADEGDGRAADSAAISASPISLAFA